MLAEKMENLNEQTKKHLFKRLGNIEYFEFQKQKFMHQMENIRPDDVKNEKDWKNYARDLFLRKEKERALNQESIKIIKELVWNLDISEEEKWKMYNEFHCRWHVAEMIFDEFMIEFKEKNPEDKPYVRSSDKISPLIE